MDFKAAKNAEDEPHEKREETGRMTFSQQTALDGLSRFKGGKGLTHKE